MAPSLVIEAGERLLTPSEAARVLDVTAGRVRQLANAGELPVALRTGQGRLIRSSAVAALAAARLARRQAIPAAP